MPDCMRQLGASGAREAVIEATRAKPFLGLCIGLQMLFERGEEGDTAGLGRAAGPGAALRRSPGLKIPHMGWNEVIQAAVPPAVGRAFPTAAASISCTATTRRRATRR